MDNSRKKYTKEEDVQIVGLSDMFGHITIKQCKSLAKKLGRKDTSIYQRYYLLKNKAKFPKKISLENNDCPKLYVNGMEITITDNPIVIGDLSIHW